VGTALYAVDSSGSGGAVGSMSVPGIGSVDRGHWDLVMKRAVGRLLGRRLRWVGGGSGFGWRVRGGCRRAEVVRRSCAVLSGSYCGVGTTRAEELIE
jgi:hypothetical protein